jgi:hypothetical protein
MEICQHFEIDFSPAVTLPSYVYFVYEKEEILKFMSSATNPSSRRREGPICKYISGLGMKKKIGNESRRDRKPRVAMLARTGSSLLLCCALPNVSYIIVTYNNWLC